MKLIDSSDKYTALNSEQRKAIHLLINAFMVEPVEITRKQVVRILSTLYPLIDENGDIVLQTGQGHELRIMLNLNALEGDNDNITQ